jgi:hypothetical protein
LQGAQFLQKEIQIDFAMWHKMILHAYCWGNNCRDSSVLTELGHNSQLVQRVVVITRMMFRPLHRFCGTCRLATLAGSNQSNQHTTTHKSIASVAMQQINSIYKLQTVSILNKLTGYDKRGVNRG